MPNPEQSFLSPEEPKTKICTSCFIEKPIEAFSKNQFGKNNRVLRRPVCRDCYSKKVKINPKEKKEYEVKRPRPKIGQEFKCPICHRKKMRSFKNDVVLDHSHIDGSVRGWVCSSCNTSIGKFYDDPAILQRAIDWIKNKGDSLLGLILYLLLTN
ncbi:MAG: endonuclease domain-containing protein [Bacteroidetes bacterium]|nr:endonuclease domain-containing protein [Bacteroidota bacterium]